MTASERMAPGPWSVPVRIEDVPEGGQHVTLSADVPTREKVAKLAGLANLPRFDASFDVVRHGAGGLRVSGEVVATVGQTCVVSLEPMENEVRENVDLIFAPGESTSGAKEELSHAEEPPEPLREGTVDLGAIATEFLILGIDPYPRKPGVVFSAPQAEEAEDHPFAALAALKKRNKPPE